MSSRNDRELLVLMLLVLLGIALLSLAQPDPIQYVHQFLARGLALTFCALASSLLVWLCAAVEQLRFRMNRSFVMSVTFLLGLASFASAAAPVTPCDPSTPYRYASPFIVLIPFAGYWFLRPTRSWLEAILAFVLALLLSALTFVVVTEVPESLVS